ncbi:MAG: hypothetical protein DMG76_34315 [Acidobacteria bacterium]|nr:MAG: hypothetical protein DMG76_34315 [Acidobacteriota bacterium]
MKIAVEAELQSERTATPLRVKTADLSLDGFYVEMMFTLEVGTKLKIVLWIDDVKVSIGGIVMARPPSWQRNRVYRNGSRRPSQAQTFSDS